MLSRVSANRLLSRSRLLSSSNVLRPSSSCVVGVFEDTTNNNHTKAVPAAVVDHRFRFQSTSAATAEHTASSPAAAATSKAPESSQKEETKFVPTPERKYQFFENPVIRDDGVGIIKIDCLGKKVNTISFAMAEEAKQMFAEYENDDRIKAIVVMSAKPDNFIAGADIFDIKEMMGKGEGSEQELLKIIEDGVDFFQNKIRAKEQPVVCAINGSALGGGLEWAMWCDYRICTSSPKTVLGLPEVKLGLLPGFGGTQNLIPLVGLQAGMDMMLTGKNIYPQKAKKMGLVDLVVDPAALEKVAIDTALQLADGTLKRKKKKKSLVNKILEDSSVGRHFVWKEIQKLVDKNTNGKQNYPSPYAIIECVKHGIENNTSKDISKGLKFEREQFAKLTTTNAASSLISIFEGMTKMKKHEYGAKTAVDVKNIAVMGAGLMGAGIAQVSAQKDYNVLLKDQNSEGVERGLDYMQANWSKKVKKRALSQYDANRYSSNITPLSGDTYNDNWESHFKNCDLIIEAVFEDIDLKKKIIADVERVVPEHCIFATNTSAIPITSIAEGSQRPENIIGMHYFSPVPMMPLLEIIPHENSSDTAIATAYEVGAKQGKTCIVVKDVPGFYVNRCLGPYLTEVCGLAADGVGLEKIDKAMKNFGMPVGPITLLDEVGIDVTCKVAQFLSKADLGNRMEGGEIRILEEMVNRGYLGKKTGKGFYTYNPKAKGKKKKIMSDEVKGYAKQFEKRQLNLEEKEIQDRMICRFVNEAAKSLEDEIIANPAVGDIGMVFGTGFAPFRGGPFHYLDSVGVSQYVDMMMGFTDKYGVQFEPCQLLKDYAQTNKKFFPNN